MKIETVAGNLHLEGFFSHLLYISTMQKCWRYNIVSTNLFVKCYKLVKVTSQSITTLLLNSHFSVVIHERLLNILSYDYLYMYLYTIQFLN